MRRGLAASILLVAWGAGSLLTGCDMILGIGDLEVPGKGEGDDGDWSFDGGAFNRDASRDVRAPSDAASDVSTDTNTATKRRVFITADAISANFGGVAAAHAKCNAAATEAKLGGNWFAWVSAEGSRAIDNLTFDGRYELVTGTLVAANKAALIDGALDAKIDVAANGEKVGGIAGVWTGTKVDGTAGASCKNWTVASFGTPGLAGSKTETDKRWTDHPGDVLGGGWNCSWTGHLYCFER